MLVPVVLVMVGTLGLPSALVFFVARGGNTVHLGREILVFAVALAGLLTLADAVLVVAAFSQDPPDVFAAVIPTIAVTPLVVFQTMVVALHQGRSDLAAMNVTRVVPFAAWGLGVTALWATGSMTLASTCVVFLLAYTISALVAAVSLRRIEFGPGTGSPRLSDLVGFGMRGMIGTISPLENLRLDQLVIGTFQSPAALGQYSTAQAFYAMPRLFGASIGIAYPDVAHADPARQRRLVVRNLLLSAASIGTLTAGIMVTIPFVVPFLFGDAFEPSVPIAEVLLLASFAFALRRLAADLLRGFGRPGSDSMVEIATWPVLAVGLIAVARTGPLEVAVVVVASAAVGLGVSLLLVANPSASCLERRARRRRSSVSRSRAFVLAAISAGLVGVAVAGADLQSRAVLLLVIGTATLVPVIRKAITRSLDPLEPLVMASAAFSILFLARPLYDLIRGDV